MGVGAGLYMYVVVVQKFTFAISSPDEFLSKFQWEALLERRQRNSVIFSHVTWVSMIGLSFTGF